MIKKIVLSVAILFFIFQNAFSQEQLGIRIENYAGINGVSLNPSHSLDYPLAWNLNLAGNGFFVDNNYAYVTNSTLNSLIKNETAVDFAPKYKGNRPANTPLVDFPTKHTNRYFHLHNITMGPALGLRFGNHAAGIFFNARLEGSAARIPKLLNFYYLDTIPYKTNLTAPEMTFTLMAWRETGINYAYKIETNNGFLQIGANLKHLTGYETVWAKSNSDFIFARYKNDSLRVDAPSVSFGFSNANLDNIKNETYKLQPTGNGFGFDLGVSYLIENNDFDNYVLRFGAAINDIGKVNFSSKVEEHLISYSNSASFNGKPYYGVKSPKEAIRTLSQQAYDDPNKSFVDSTFSVGLPTALTLQADYQFFPNAYANATLVQRLPYQEVGVRRENILAVSGRYEHRWLAGMLSMQLYEFKRVRLGLSARLAFLTIGTDNLGSLIGKSNFYGSDFYFAFKLNPFGLNVGKPSWFERKGKGGKGNGCYEF